MLDVSTTQSFEACAAFAVRWLGRIAAYDLIGAEELIDVNESDSPFALSFPAPDGFTYCPPERARNWSMNIVSADEAGLRLDFEVPFVEQEFRPMVARFDMRRIGSQLEVRFTGLVPS